MPDIPHGYCHCNCGQKTQLATQNHAARGWIKGQPLRYIRGHYGKVQKHEPDPDLSAEAQDFLKAFDRVQKESTLENQSRYYAALGRLLNA